jgi:hypothetical protein
MKDKNIDKKGNPPGYPLYPANEDIYNQSQKEENINPDENPEMDDSVGVDKGSTDKARDFEDDFSGDDLDVPGSELDDEQESIGNEDEENNYYSIGGDNHNDLEEDQGL